MKNHLRKQNPLKQVLRAYNIELELYRGTGMFLKDAAFIESTEAFVESRFPDFL